MQLFLWPAFDMAKIATIAFSPFIGSFLGVLILRLPDARPIGFTRSRCDHCDTVLGASDLVPLLSYGWLGGHCRHCRGSIDGFYPAVELAALAVAISAGLLSSPNSVLINCAFGWVLLVLAWIDVRTYLLPDRLTLPLIVAGVVQAWFLHHALVTSLIGAAVGYLSIWLIEIVYRRLRGRDGIGLGDAKLLAVAGAWLGWENLPVVVLTASLCALIAVGVAQISGRTMKNDSAIAFGPFLALAMWIVILVNPIAMWG